MMISRKTVLLKCFARSNTIRQSYGLGKVVDCVSVCAPPHLCTKEEEKSMDAGILTDNQCNVILIF